MATFRKLKINFFSTDEGALDRAVLLEKRLMTLGHVSASRSGGISQFHLSTELTVEEVRVKIAELKLSGDITVGEEENDEMVSA